MHRVVGLCLDWTVAFDLASPAQVFTAALDSRGGALYEVRTCSPGGAPVATTTGFAITPSGGLELLAEADTVVVPASGIPAEAPAEEVLEALRSAAAAGARVVSVCTGAFVLGHAGLLDGRRATTHWGWAEELASLFPRADVDPTALYVDEGAVLTSAGLSSGIDLSLHIVREDHGAAAGARVARRMVAAPHREGGQAQFIERTPVDDAGSLEPTRGWAVENLAEPLDVAAMADHAAVSPRTFARRFREETGTTPHQWLLTRRVDQARRLLEETDLPIDQVAWDTGFGTAASLRDHFKRATKTTPSAYRRAFMSAAGVG